MKEILIEEVVKLLLPEEQFKLSKAAGGYNLDCPFCNGKKKFHIDTASNVARCAKCGNGEDPTKGFNVITLYAKLKGCSTQDAAKALNAFEVSEPVKKAKPFKSSKYIQKLAPANIRNVFYQTMLDNMYLSVKHFENLSKRGLSEEKIKNGGYLSVYTTDTKEFTKRIWNSFPEKEKNEFIQAQKKKVDYVIPGFINLWSKEKMDMIQLESGFTVPVRNLNGNISGFQIRFDNPKDGAKYKWLTSSFKRSGSGVSEINQIHYVGFKEYVLKHKAFPKAVILTEGALKADVASCLSGYPFIAVMGVSCLSQVPRELARLKSKGVERIIVAYDSDDNKKEVKAAKRKLIEKIQEAGLEILIASWGKKYKGIDDALLAKKNGEKVQINFHAI